MLVPKIKIVGFWQHMVKSNNDQASDEKKAQDSIEILTWRLLCPKFQFQEDFTVIIENLFSIFEIV